MNEQKNIDEKKLIQRLSQGDEMAFEILFYRYRGKVGNFIKRSVPPQIDLEETVHEVFLRVWTNKEKLDEDRPLGPYLFHIARNIVIDELRKNLKHSIYLQDDSFLSDFCINDTSLKLEEKELQNWFDSALDKLPEKRRDIFVMNRFENLSYKEIASKLNISENTVDTQIRRALQYFRNEIKKIKMFLFLNF
ncbi:MAG: RNA polymerase sigma-70 factor [Bacteroidota bacterium]|nr:RNA polymerase sigma-70 factor [Bacteroidota bacterium]MDP4205650.1 RNA polymerase sigma-70 factor [Bacteroidota bacterium]